MTEKEMLSEVLKFFYNDRGKLIWGIQEDMYCFDDNLNSNLLRFIEDNQININA